MCGRIALYTPPSRLARFFEARAAAGLGSDELDRDLELPPSWNVAPSREVLTVVARRPRPEDDEHRTPENDSEHRSEDDRSSGGAQSAEAQRPHIDRLLVPSRWGLVPWWAKDPRIGNGMINARAETVATQPAFRRAFERRRCLVAADGFYEWLPPPGGKGRSKGRSQPFYYRRSDGQPLALAGLWEVWRPRNPSQGRSTEGLDQLLRTCTIVVTEAGPDVAPVHDRMPVVIEPGDWDEWLGIEEVGQEALSQLLTPSPAGTLVAHPVDARVSHPDVDGPEVIQPVDQATKQAIEAASQPQAVQGELPLVAPRDG